MTAGVIIVKLMCSNQLKLTEKYFSYAYGYYFKQVRSFEYKTFDFRLGFTCQPCFLDLFPTNFIVTTNFC